MNAKYYGRRLQRLKGINTAADIAVAITASSSFAGLAIWKSQLGVNVFSVALGLSALISALRPVFRLSDNIDRYSKLHYGYLEVFYRIQSLVSDMRTSAEVTTEHRSKALDLPERFRALELEGDAYQNPSKLLKIQDEVDISVPTDQLWLPQR